MGGFGSGRSGWRSTVEDCRALDVNRWVQLGLLKPGTWRSGSLVWTYPGSDEVTGSISYEVDMTALHNPHARLCYTITDPFSDEKHHLDYEVQLTTTYPHFGGVRWWFICPLHRKGFPCGRRVGKLYLPPGGRYFGCRTCYNLTYTSCNESHKFDGLYALMARDMARDIPGVTPLMVKHAVEAKLLRKGCGRRE